MYEQFTYGKMHQFAPEDIIACTHALDNHRDRLRLIAREHSFWRYPLEKRQRRAVGAFQVSNSFFGQDILIIVHAYQIPPRTSGDNSYSLHRYILIPVKDVENAQLRDGIYELLLHFVGQQIPSSINRLEQVTIPLLCNAPDDRNSRLNEEDVCRIIESILSERDRREEPFLITAISGLLNAQNVLINKTSSESAESFYRFFTDIFKLLPAACRYEISVAIGSFQEASCQWAKLLFKSERINDQGLPQDVLRLNREQNEVYNRTGYNSSSEYVQLLKEILTQPDKEWVKSLLEELNGLKDSSWKLQQLRDFQRNQRIESSDREIKIGLWGVPGAGKTTYILRLYTCMKASSSGFNIDAADTISEDFTRNKNLQLSEHGFITATAPGEEKYITYRLRTKYTLIPQTIILTFLDAPGGYYESLALYNADQIENIRIQANNQANNGEGGLAQNLANSDGIIFLLSPDLDKQNAASHKAMIPNVLQVLRRYSRDPNNPSLDQDDRLTQFIAFCVTKVDKVTFWNDRENADQLVTGILGRTVIDGLNNDCFYNQNYPEDSRYNRCKFFAISAIGRYKDENTGEMLEAIDYPGSTIGSSHPGTFDFPHSSQDQTHDDSTNIGRSDSDTFQVPMFEEGNTDLSDVKSQDFQGEKIKSGVNPEPLNVVDPIKWLIRKIYAHSLR